MIGIGNTWLALQFDSAVGTLGRWVDAKLEEWTGEGKSRRRRYTVQGLIADLEQGAALAYPHEREKVQRLAGRSKKPQRQFADPMQLVRSGAAELVKR